MRFAIKTISPVYEESGIELYLGDCREILPLLDEGLVDLLLTDPPYGYGYVTHRLTKESQLRDRFGGNNLEIVAEALIHCDRLLRENSHIYLFADPRKVGEVQDLLDPPFKIKNIIAWDKGDQGTAGDLVCGYGMNWEAIVYAMKGRKPLNGPRPRAMLRYPWSSNRDPVHPTVKPVEILKKLILNSSNKGDVVLDPFAGSGTTLAAAKLTGRKAIGIEQDEQFVEVAISRLKAI